MTDTFAIILPFAVFIISLLAGFYLLKSKKLDLEKAQKNSEEKIQKAMEEAQKIAEETTLRAKALREKSKETEAKQKQQFERLEHLIISKEEQLGKKKEKMDEAKKQLEEEKAHVETIRQKRKQLQESYVHELIQKTGEKKETLKEEIFQELQRDLDLMREDRLRKQEEYLQEEKVRIGKNMIVGAIQRYSAPTSVEKKDTTLTLPRDEMKARILGQNMGNLLLIEELTGVDIIFNDEPNTIIISCFDLVRRHNALQLINKLTKERIVTPEKIRQKFVETQEETQKTLIRIGRDTIRKLELDNRKLPDDFAKIVGRLDFRTSYGQNILKHSFEVGNFTLIIGNELGLNMETSKVGGFFHDLGKAIDQEVGGSHDVLTKEIMEKFGFPEDEIHAAWAHHDAVPQRTAEAMLVKAGDAISAGRPGARQESIEKYIERIKAIEGIASKQEGVQKVFAISAGRELRVLVEPVKVADTSLQPMAKNIATEIQANVGYPGKIKVNVIRRIQTTEMAKQKGPAEAKGSRSKSKSTRPDGLPRK